MKTSDILILPTDDAIRRKTAENVVRKYNNTDISLMYDRSPVELLDNLYMGDIAKNALAAYLRKHCSTPVTDYDEIRTDDFTEPDGGWDLMVGNSGIKAEVKSSIPPGNEADADIIARRDIKITAALDKENPVWIRPSQLESRIHIQIYFRASARKSGFSSFEELSRVISSDPEQVHTIIGSSKYDRPMFFGWTTRERICEYLRTCSGTKTWSFPWTKRIYWRSPVKTALTMPELVDFCENH